MPDRLNLAEAPTRGEMSISVNGERNKTNPVRRPRRTSSRSGCGGRNRRRSPAGPFVKAGSPQADTVGPGGHPPDVATLRDELAGPVGLVLARAAVKIPAATATAGGCRYEPKRDRHRVVVPVSVPTQAIARTGAANGTTKVWRLNLVSGLRTAPRPGPLPGHL